MLAAAAFVSWGDPGAHVEAELTSLMDFFFFLGRFGIFFLHFPACTGHPEQGWRLVRGGWAGGARGCPSPRLSGSVGLSPGAKPGEEPAGDSPKAENESQPLHGSGICKWFNVRMGFGFLSMTAKGGATLDSPVDVFVHQVRPEPRGAGEGRAARSGGRRWDGDPPAAAARGPRAAGSAGTAAAGLLSGDRPRKAIPSDFILPPLSAEEPRGAGGTRRSGDAAQPAEGPGNG